MELYALLSLLVVGCSATEWLAINNFKDTFQVYSRAALSTISSIENILDTSKNQSQLFLNNIYTNNPAVNRVTRMKSSRDKCFEKFIDEENFKFSFQIQIYQLQLPLHSRILDIRERLNNINYSLDIYSGIAESKLSSCESQNRSCRDKTFQWLESTIKSLSCDIYPNCSDHSIRKRSICEPSMFQCIRGDSGSCIRGDYFCDGEYDCPNEVDEPLGCVRTCSEFRCSETFLCISKSKKCDGVDDCGDGSDEDGCPAPTPAPNKYRNCSFPEGDFICGNDKCISLEQVCDGFNDCGDWSDEGDNCTSTQCSLECIKKGGVCFTGPKGSECLNECPPGTYETSKGCSRHPEAPLPTLLQVLEDTPRLTARYSARLKYLKIKTLLGLSRALREVVRCKGAEFSLLSKIIDFSTTLQKEGLYVGQAPDSKTTSSTGEKILEIR